MSLPWLTTIGLLPTLGALVIWGSLVSREDGAPRERAAGLARWIALGTSVLTFVLTLALAFRFDVTRAGEFQFSETHSWIPSSGSATPSASTASR